MNQLSEISKFIFEKAKKHKKEVNQIIIYIDPCYISDEFVDIVICEDDYTELERCKTKTVIP